MFLRTYISQKHQPHGPKMESFTYGVLGSLLTPKGVNPVPDGHAHVMNADEVHALRDAWAVKCGRNFASKGSGTPVEFIISAP